MREPGVMAKGRDEFEENEDLGDEEDILDLRMPKDSGAKRGTGAKQTGKKRNQGRRGRDKTRFRQSWIVSFIIYWCCSVLSVSNYSWCEGVLRSCLACLLLLDSFRNSFKTVQRMFKIRESFLWVVVCYEDLQLNGLVDCLLLSCWKINQER